MLPQTLTSGSRSARRVLSLDLWDAGAAAVVAAQLALVAWLVVPGGLYIDDVRAQAYAAERPLWPFIIESNGTHLSPGARTVDWLQANLWPLSDRPATVVTLLVAALLGLTLWRLARLLIPRTGTALLALALGLFTASLVPALAWYRQALTTLVALAATLAALDAAVRFLRGGSRRWAVVAVAAHAFGLAFSERALAVPVVVAAAVLLPRSPLAWRPRLLRAALLCVPMAVVNLVFLAAYASGEYDKAERSSPTLAGFATSTARSVATNVVPGLLGGPVRWRDVQPSYAFATTPWILTVVGLLALAVLLRRLLRAPRPARAEALGVVGLAAAYALPVYTMVYVGRISVSGSDAVDDLRLYPDVAVFAALAVAAAVGAVLPARPRRSARARAALAGVVVAGLTLVSWAGFAERWHGSRTSAYLQALEADLGRSARSGATVVPSSVPASVIPGWVQADFSTGTLVRLLSPATEVTLADGTVQMVGETGRLVPARLKPVGTAVNAQTGGFCGNYLAAGGDRATVRFRLALPYYRGSLLRLRTIVSDTTTLRVRVVDEAGRAHAAPSHTTPRLHRGPHTLLVPVPYGVRVQAVEVSSTGENADVCIPRLDVVLPVEAT